MRAFLKIAFVVIAGLSLSWAEDEQSQVQGQASEQIPPQTPTNDTSRPREQSNVTQSTPNPPPSDWRTEAPKTWWEKETRDTVQKIARGEIKPAYPPDKPENLNQIVQDKAKAMINEVLSSRENLVDMIISITSAEQAAAVTPKLAESVRVHNNLRARTALELKTLGIRFIEGRTVYSFAAEEDRARAIYVKINKEKQRLSRDRFYGNASLLSLVMYEFATKEFHRPAPCAAYYSPEERKKIQEMIEENRELITQSTGAIGGPGLTRESPWIIPITDGKSDREQLEELHEKIRLICLLLGNDQPIFDLARWRFNRQVYARATVIAAADLRRFELWFKTSPEIGLPELLDITGNKHLFALFPMVE